MKRKLTIEIDCGDTTCARASGEFCQHFGGIRFGTVPVCMLFPSDSAYTVLDASGDWTLRCQACLDAEAESE